MSEITAHGEKKLVLAAGRAHPELAKEIAKELGTELLPTGRLRLRQRRDLRPGRRKRPRHRRLRHPGAPGPAEQLAHGAADHDRFAQAGLRQAHHRGLAVLPLRPPGQEGPRPRADLRPPRRRPVQDGRRRPHHERGPAHLADPGLLRRPGGPPDGHPAARRLHPDPRRRRQHHRRVPGHRPRPRRRAVGRAPRRRARWPSCTRAATSPCPTRPSPRPWWARSRAAPAS